MRSKHPFAILSFTFLISLFLIPVNAGIDLRSPAAKTTLSFGFSRPTGVAVNVTVSGRVKTPEGKPIKGASVMLKDADTNAVVGRTFSNSFGYYKLDQIETGHMYVLTVTHRRFLFALPSQLLEINEERPGTDFTGEANN
jgi:hypothetical protein